MAAWAEQFKRHKVWLIVCEDNPTKTFKIPKLKGVKVSHYSWKEIDKDLKKDSWIIPRRCDGIRSYGFMKAYKKGYDVLTLDDDVTPCGRRDIIEIYQETRVRCSNYFDVGSMIGMGNIMGSGGELPMRGFPMKDRKLRMPFVQYGTWENVPDVDGLIQTTEGFSWDMGYAADWTITVPKDVPLTGCIMNTYIRHDAIPYMYQLLMGENKDGTKNPFNRWGDIWSGLFMKRYADLMDEPVVINGQASVVHSRASDPATNLKDEFSGYEVNERMWDYLRVSGRWYNPVVGSDVIHEYDEYFAMLQEAYDTWTKLLS